MATSINLNTYEPFEFDSSDGSSVIYAWASKTKAPKAVVQIIHGASEHSARYFDFADFLLGKGFAVCGHDHIGHGRTAREPKDLGVMPSSIGWKVLVEDTYRLYKTAVKMYENAPYVMFGHSMGSFILRNYLIEHSNGLSGAIISGTGQPNPLFTYPGLLFAKATASRKGDSYVSRYVAQMAKSSYSNKGNNYSTPADWLSTNKQAVEAFLADEYCGSEFSLGAYATLAELSLRMVSKELAAKISPDLPLYFISGSEDDLGEKGEAVYKAVKEYKSAGSKNVELKLFEGMRHEILNEIGNIEVYEGIASWLEKQLSL